MPAISNLSFARTTEIEKHFLDRGYDLKFDILGMSAFLVRRNDIAATGQISGFDA
jgi:hypothetical protein